MKKKRNDFKEIQFGGSKMADRHYCCKPTVRYKNLVRHVDA